MFTVYILYSQKLDRYYVGHTSDLEPRLLQHNTGFSTFTAKAADWKTVYTEHYDTRQLARQRERIIKAKKSRKYIEWLIQSSK